MIATLISAVFALILYFIPSDIPYVWPLAHLLFVTPILAVTLFLGFTAAPLAETERRSLPRLIDRITKDNSLKLNILLVLLSSIVALFLGAFSFQKIGLVPDFGLLGLIVLSGFVIDRLKFVFYRVFDYLNPYKVINFYAEQTQKYIQEDNIEEIIRSIDSISEMANNSIRKYNSTLASESIGQLKTVGVNFLKAAKSLPNLNKDLSSYESTHADRVSFTFLTLIKRLETIADFSIKNNIEPLVNQVNSALGRLSISAAKYDISLSTVPLQTIGIISQKAVQQGLKEVGFRSLVLLPEIAKAIPENNNDLAFQEIKTSYNALLQSIDGIDKELFRTDKTMDIGILKEPFLRLNQLFDDPFFLKHQDGPSIKSISNQYLDEYRTLEAVLSTIPQNITSS